MSAQPRDQEQRIEAATWTRGPVLVEAGAGTGKTTLLVERIVHLIRAEGARLGEIAAITFTRKATAELKDRIRARLIQAVTREEDAETRERFQDALDNLESARISTIHGFALNILRGFSVEAGLRPDLGDVDEIEHDARRDAAWRDWLAQVLGGGDAQLRDFLELGFPVADLVKIRDAMLDLPELREHFPRVRGASPDEIRAAIDDAFEAWAEVGCSCVNEEDKAFQEIEKARGWLEGLRGLSQTALLRELWNPGFKLRGNVGSQKNWGDKETGKATLELFRQKHDLFWAELERGASVIAHEMLAALVPLIRGFSESFEREMREAGLLSYQDMLFLAAKLVRENASVRSRIRESIRHFLVDEFQDTDPLQVELIFLLAGEGDAADWRGARIDDAGLFLVGDPKQSIYRFRRADIAIYHEVKEKIRSLANGRLLHITENFRSTPGVVDFVNEAFSRVIVQDTDNPNIQPGYVELLAHRESTGPAVFLIRKKEDEDEPERSGRMKEEERRKNEAACLAAAIRELVEEKRVEITDRDNNARRPVNYWDVAVLFRVRTGYAQFEDAFRAAGVPYITDGGRGFYDKFEVGAVVSVLSAVARPGDPLALAAALRSPLYGFSDVEIARQFLKTQEPPEALKEAVREICLLHEVKKGSSARAILEEIYRRTRAFELFLASSGGEQRVANLLKLLDMAHDFAGNGRRGVDAFATHLEAQYELGREAREPEAFLDARGAEAVRFMTIHQAKGLEFPVVALADLEGKDEQRQDEPLVDRQKGAVDLHLGSGSRRLDSAGYASALEREIGFHNAELKRLWYVGATRAEDYLLWPESGFHGFMNSVGLPEEEIDEVIQAASASVIEVSPEESREPEPILRLGDAVFRPANGDSAEFVDQRSALDEKLKRLKKPVETRMPLAPSGLVKGFDGVEPVASKTLDDEDARKDPEVHAGGMAFGSLVHSILARLDPPSPERLESLQVEGVTYARALNLKEEDVDLAMDLIRNSVDSGVLARAVAAPRRWRELPFTFELDDRVIRGFIDLVFEERGRLIVVDFKTDMIAASEVNERASLYADQGGAYVMGLEAATGFEVGELVFSFLRPGVDVSCPVDDVLRQRVREAVTEAE